MILLRRKMNVQETIAFKNGKKRSFWNENDRFGMKTIVFFIKNDRFGNNRLEIKPIVLERKRSFLKKLQI